MWYIESRPSFGRPCTKGYCRLRRGGNVREGRRVDACAQSSKGSETASTRKGSATCPCGTATACTVVHSSRGTWSRTTTRPWMCGIMVRWCVFVFMELLENQTPFFRGARWARKSASLHKVGHALRNFSIASMSASAVDSHLRGDDRRCLR